MIRRVFDLLDNKAKAVSASATPSDAAAERAPGYVVRVAMLEIHNGNVRDLLMPLPAHQQLQTPAPAASGAGTGTAAGASVGAGGSVTDGTDAKGVATTAAAAAGARGAQHAPTIAATAVAAGWNGNASSSSLDVRRGADGMMEVVGLTWREIRRDGDGYEREQGQEAGDPDTVLKVLKEGSANRATAPTNMTQHSSRSHLIVLVDVIGVGAAGAEGSAVPSMTIPASRGVASQTQRRAAGTHVGSQGGHTTASGGSAHSEGPPQSQQQLSPANGNSSSTSMSAFGRGRLMLVDLAGSERVKKSEVREKELVEAQHINKSLSALGDVLEALDRKSKFVPYRNSRLTFLLQVKAISMSCIHRSHRTNAFASLRVVPPVC